MYEDTTVDLLTKKNSPGVCYHNLMKYKKYLYFINKTVGNIIGFKLVENKDYPDYALREALINACVHRNFPDCPYNRIVSVVR